MVIYQESLHDARSTKCTISCFTFHGHKADLYRKTRNSLIKLIIRKWGKLTKKTIALICCLLVPSGLGQICMPTWYIYPITYQHRSTPGKKKGSNYMTLPPPVFCSTKSYKEVRSVFKYVCLIEGQNFRDSLDPGRAPRLVCLPGRSPASPTLYDWPCIYIQVIIVLHAIPSDAYTDKNIHCPWLSISMNLMIRVADTHSSGDTC